MNFNVQVAGGSITFSPIPGGNPHQSNGVQGEVFTMAADASFVPSTLNLDSRTVDVCWYGGATVPRIDYNTGDRYMLRFDMAGCRLDRLNAGAPFFDNHMSGVDLASMFAGVSGSKAQLATITKAWTDGPKGMATLKFTAPEEGDEEDDPANEMFQGIASGKFRNLSFGTFIYEKKIESSTTNAAGDTLDTYVATDWEPYEISQANVPADYTTSFLTAQTQQTGGAEVPKKVDQQPKRAPAQTTKEPPVMEINTTTQAAGAPARAVTMTTNETTDLAAVRADAVRLDRERFQAIRQMIAPFNLDAAFSATIESLSVEDARVKVMEKLSADADQGRTTTGITITRDVVETRRECMENALLMRYSPTFYTDLAKSPAHVNNPLKLAELQAEQANMRQKGREYVGLTLLEMAKECLAARNINTRGWGKDRIAEEALRGRVAQQGETFGVGAESSSDFPSVLANVANKSLRQAYQALPRTFTPFSRMVTAADFKPVNRVQLSDTPALMQLNEKGEYHRATLTDSNETYSLATFGEVVGITRKVIINDDLQAFTRVPFILGTAAARLEGDKVWAIFTANAAMGDAIVLFHASHSNLLSGAGSAIQVSALAASRKSFRLQTGPQGTILNLTPSYLIVPAALETTAYQLLYPQNLAVTSVTAGIPEWIRSLAPITEPRLDANSSTAWYVIADPTAIDTIEYCYLEGQEGVYMETRQGFEVDGIEIKARLDFAAKAIDWRGIQKNAGA